MAIWASFVSIALALFAAEINAAPVSEAQKLADPSYGPIPGQSSLYSTYYEVPPVFPGNITDPILPTKKGPPGVDDVTWQNLLSAEWIIYSFYQQGVEAFNASSFVAAGYPNNTYQRIMEIRNNENGHLRIFQNQISSTSVKPGACKYQFPFYDPTSFLALTTVLEVSSMSFLTGLVQQAKIDMAKGSMLAIAETETRHEVWTLLEIWKTNPFAGPSDTVFPYANEILDTTNSFIVPGSCPPENLEYPSPRQHLPALSAAEGTKSLEPGATISLNFTDATNQPSFCADKQYYAVFFHAVSNISVPIDTSCWPEKAINVTIPAEFEKDKGVVIAVVADTPGAPTKETVVAGPGIILEQPAALAVALL
ncbi:putative stress response protein rds1p-like protein [Phaeoacremonium minimum UCRPA7]|uniref:Putative stress response protein rds1p-like protein n=1 Tax=Phaeoacremonium minimum (strain UCR-PA7) TaxID=1286976 RepID=R8BG58_PHAM7|nr:putative stress response protein rds1p-like protein [Phaeoacremonium minimum UCRPA7]EON98274.1 putative stress response protein rds1p-like protein [Phaeoacremonium minimum UCRPA7]